MMGNHFRQIPLGNQSWPYGNFQYNRRYYPRISCKSPLWMTKPSPKSNKKLVFPDSQRVFRVPIVYIISAIANRHIEFRIPYQRREYSKLI